MPPKKGLSAAEKRERILRLLNEKKEVFSYAQIEKEAEKINIRRDVVKEILEALISDALIETETLGVSKCYWSLPSQTLIKLRDKCVEYSEKIESANLKITELKKQTDSLKNERGPCPERTELEQNLESLKKETEVLEKEVQAKSRNYPGRLKKLKEETEESRDQANEWTDNVNQLIYYLKNQAGMSAEQLEQLGLPKEIENI